MKLYHARYIFPLIGGANKIQEENFYLPDVSSVRRQLRSKGLWPIDIQELKPPLFEWMNVRSREWQLQLLRAIRFQTATASAGTALLNIIEGETDPRRRLAFLPTRTVLKGGGSFSEALRELKLLDAATMAIITAGERAGDLKGVIQHAIEHVEQKGSQYKTIVTALSWLSFDIASIISTIWGLQFGFIPYMEGAASKNAEPEAAARLAHGIKLVKIINGSMLVGTTVFIIAVVFLFVTYWINRYKPRHFTARLMMKMPLFSSYLRNTALQDSCKLMSRLIRGKVPLTEGLKIIMESVVEPAALLYWRESEGRIMAGVEPSKALARWPLSKAERDQIVTVQSVDQISEVYGSIAEERQLMAKADQRKLVKWGLYLFLLITGITVLTFIYLLMLQNQGFLNNMSQTNAG
jgi:type II secretory pathway component PulF